MRKFCLLLFMCVFACGAIASTYFQPDTGNYNVASNWDKGAVPPDSGDEIKMVEDGQVCTVDQIQLLYVNTKISISGGPAGSSMEILPGGYIGNGREFRVGSAGTGGGGNTGSLNHRGGTLEINGDGKLMIGYKLGGNGTYTISGGGLHGTDGARMYIGCEGEAGSTGTLIVQGTDPNIIFDGRIYLASNSASGDSRLGTATLQYDLVAGAVSPIIANGEIAIDAGGGGTANLIVNSDAAPAADILLVQNPSTSDIPGVFDTFNGASGAEGTVVNIAGSLMKLTYRYDADGDGQDNDLALILLAFAGDLPHDPAPADDATVSLSLAALDWVNPDPNIPGNSIYCDVYLGTEPNRLGDMEKVELTTADVSQINISEFTTYGTLQPTTQYFWAVDAHDGSNTIEGPYWSFTTVGLAPEIETYDNVITASALLPAALSAVVTDNDNNVTSAVFTVTDSPSGSSPVLQNQAGGLYTPSMELNTDTEGTYQVKLTMTDADSNIVEATAEVKIYDDACEAAQNALSWTGFNIVDLDTDCDVDLADLAILAGQWLDDRNLDAQETY